MNHLELWKVFQPEDLGKLVITIIHSIDCIPAVKKQWLLELQGK